MKLKIGSRESALAVVQAKLLMQSIAQNYPAIELELITMKTTGDVILDRSLDKIGGKGLFVKELDQALLDGRVDLTVHSCKDLPMDLPPELPVAAFSKREEPRDVLVLPRSTGEIDFSKPIGCSSLRRKCQLSRIFPNARLASVRGNVPTRLEKLASGEFSALVLAGAGLKRLGLEGRISRYFTVEEILPAAGQGILAVQCRSGENTFYLSGFADTESALCAAAERAYVRTLGGGCSSPVAAYAQVREGKIFLQGMDASGRCGEIFGEASKAAALGEKLAKTMRREAAK